MNPLRRDWFSVRFSRDTIAAVQWVPAIVFQLFIVRQLLSTSKIDTRYITQACNAVIYHIENGNTRCPCAVRQARYCTVWNLDVSNWLIWRTHILMYSNTEYNIYYSDRRCDKRNLKTDSNYPTCQIVCDFGIFDMYFSTCSVFLTVFRSPTVNSVKLDIYIYNCASIHTIFPKV